MTIDIFIMIIDTPIILVKWNFNRLTDDNVG